MEAPRISIIVPVYNAESTISKCINSIINQEYTNWELILINDGSKDSSSNICDSYAQIDNRIRSYHQQNKGASIARNLGLSLAKGELITFIDSDDFVDKTYLQLLINDWIKLPNKHGIVIQSCYKGQQDMWIKRKNEDFIAYKKEEMELAIKKGLFRFSEPHSKLYNLQIIRENKLEFPEGIKIGEDGIFIAKYLRYIECAILSNNAGYYYVTSVDSVSHQIYTPEQELKSFLMWKEELEHTQRAFCCDQTTYMWELISVPLYRYIRSFLQSDMTLHDKIHKLNDLDVSYTLNYGIGRKYTIEGKVFKFLVNHRQFFLLTCLYRLKSK